MQHKLWWQFLQMVWQFPSFYFFPVQFQIKRGVLSSLCKVKEAKAFPCYHLTDISSVSDDLSNAQLCLAILLFLTLYLYKYIKIFVFTLVLCYLTPRSGVGSKTGT